MNNIDNNSSYSPLRRTRDDNSGTRAGTANDYLAPR